MTEQETELFWMKKLADVMARARSDIMFRLAEHGADIVSTFTPDAATMKSFIYLVVTTWNATIIDKSKMMIFPMLSDLDKMTLPTPSAAKPKAKRK